MADHQLLQVFSYAEPNAVNTGTDAEMVCPGGEVAFVGQMVMDSVVLRDTVHWYTSMVGKKSTLKTVKLLLRQHGATAVRTTELAQGIALTIGRCVFQKFIILN